MMGWKEYKIQDVAVNIFSGGTPSTKNSGYYNGNIPWLNTKEINFRKINGTLSSISESGLLNSAAKWVPENSVIVAMYGVTAGKVAINAIPLTTNQACCNIVVNNDKFDFKFIYYSLYNSYLELKNLSSGAAQQNLNVNIISNFTISLPDLVEQRAIATVLCNLDDKIDLLHRQNDTLEAMAEALFRQWFVVEAKEDWEEKTLGDFFPITTGKKNSNYSTEDGKFPFFTCSKKVLLAPSYSFDGAAILLSGNGYFDVKRYNGKFEAYQRTYVLIPDDARFYNFLYIAIKMFLNDITQDYRGSVINFITKGMIENFPLLMPRENIDNKLQRIDIIFSRIDANVSQIRTLEKLRDTLLPKLMSGEVRVSLD